MFNITYYLPNDKTKLFTTNVSDNNIDINTNFNNNRYIINIIPKTNIIIKKAITNFDIKINENDKFFLNGYQSWTDTKEFYLNEKEKLSNRASSHFKKNKENNVFDNTSDILINQFAFDRYGDVLLYDYHKNKMHGYDIFYIKGENEFFSFNYNYQNANLIYEINKKDKTLLGLAFVKDFLLSKDTSFTLFDYAIYDNINDGLNAFYQLFNLKEEKKIFGYTSWYNYYQNINEEIILRDLDALDEKFNLFQIDDGYETYVGDWLDINPSKFPHGLKDIVNKIHDKGYKAGIWLAPFIAEEKSKLFNNHKELFKKDDNGNYIKCGGNWSGFYVLDIYNQDSINYITKCLNYYLDLGFDFFKLDFLYTVTLPYYKDHTKAMVTNDAYKLIRNILGNKEILGCGALIFNSSPYFDYLRIGPDVSLKFDDVFYMRIAHRERISTKITLQNTIYRNIFNKHLFFNDSDVFLLRDTNIKLSKDQKEALLIINALFGNVLMTSDNIASYNDTQKEMLNMGFDLFYHANNVSYKREKENIIISYKLNDVIHQLTYNTNKGVLKHDR